MKSHSYMLIVSGGARCQWRRRRRRSGLPSPAKRSLKRSIELVVDERGPHRGHISRIVELLIEIEVVGVIEAKHGSIGRLKLISEHHLIAAVVILIELRELVEAIDWVEWPAAACNGVRGRRSWRMVYCDLLGVIWQIIMFLLGSHSDLI